MLVCVFQHRRNLLGGFDFYHDLRHVYAVYRHLVVRKVFVDVRAGEDALAHFAQIFDVLFGAPVGFEP